MVKTLEEELEKIYDRLGKRAIEIAEDRARSVEKTLNLAVSHRIAILRDLSTTALASLGGGLTILTVTDAAFVKNMYLFLGGMGILTVCCILTFLCRIKLSAYLETSSLLINTQRLKLIQSAINVMEDSSNQETQDAFSAELREAGKKSPSAPLHKFYSYSDAYISIGILVGVAICVTGLFFPSLF